MEKEIEEIIKKNLPQQVGETLKKTLEKGEQDAKTVAVLEQTRTTQLDIINRHEKTISEYKANDARNSTLDAREKELDKKARELEIETLKFQLLSEKEKTEFTKSVALGLVRNTEYRKDVFDSENQNGYYDGQGRWVQPTPTAKSHTEEKKAQ